MYKWEALAVAATLFGATPASHADLVTWNLNATFDDGSTANGFFNVDIDEDFIPLLTASSWDIKTTPGTSVTAGAEYTSALADASAPLILASYYSKESGTTVPIVTFALADPSDPSNPHKILRNLI